jgi:hypothetical protein
MSKLKQIQQPEIAPKSPAELFLDFLITETKMNSHQLAAMGIGIAALSVLLTLHGLDKKDKTKSAQAWIAGREKSYPDQVIKFLTTYLGKIDGKNPIIDSARRKITQELSAAFGNGTDSFQGGLHAEAVAKYIGPGPDPYGHTANLPESARQPLNPKTSDEDNE